MNADACRRSIANVVIGTLFADRPGDIFLLDSQVLDAVNNSTIAILFDNAMKLLRGGEVKRENVLLFLTDGVPYIVKAGKCF